MQAILSNYFIQAIYHYDTNDKYLFITTHLMSRQRTPPLWKNALIVETEEWTIQAGWRFDWPLRSSELIGTWMHFNLHNKYSKMSSTQFVALYRYCKPKS